MRRVAYGGESFVTSDEAGEALLDLAAAAAMSGVAEVVQVPRVRGDGSLELVKLVIGPSSELLMAPVDSLLAEPETSEATATLRERTAALGAMSSHSLGAPIAASEFDSDYLDSESFTPDELE